jgi:hypothetical protein
MSDEGNGKITLPYKWRDEEGEFDLTNPNDLEQVKQLVNKGYGYQKGQEELKAVKGELSRIKEQSDYWNAIIEEARDTDDSSKVAAALAMVGVKIGKKQSDEEILDEGDKKLDEMNKKIEMLETALYTKYTTDTHSQLEAKYNNGKYPEYKRKEVEDYANKRGIRDFEDAYFIMNKEEIMKMEKEEAQKTTKSHKKKIDQVASDEPGAGALPPKPVEKHKNYGQASSAWLSDPAVTENLFTDE